MLTPDIANYPGVIGMEEAKKIFPGNIISKLIFVFSALGLVGLLVGSIFFGGGDVSGITDYLHLPSTKLFGIDSIYYLAVVLGIVAILSNQHKAVFMKKADEDKVHFWKQFTPYFTYARKEIDVKDLSYWVKKRKTRDYINANLTDGDRQETTTIYTTYVYENNRKFFVLDGETDFFHKILGKGPSRSQKHKNSLVDLMVNFIRRG
jgi:hypothetical protein